jgi:hypothetical protein
MDYAGQTSPDFSAFLVERAAASRAILNGDAEPLCSLTAPVGECTFFDPLGGYTVGLEAVRERYRHGAARNDRGIYDFEPIASGAQGSLGYVCGIQRSSVWRLGRPDPVVLDLRVTEIYGRAAGGWAVVHRHADQLPS